MEFIFDPSLVLYLPLYQLDGACFMSKDTYGHICTVTGALWRPKGTYFDGTDDKIVVPDHPAWAFGSSDFTFEFWFKPSQTASQVDLITQSDGVQGDDNNYFRLRHSDAINWRIKKAGAVALNFGTDAGEISADTWYHIVMTRTGGSTYACYKNGDSINFSGSGAGTTVPDWSDKLVLGARHAADAYWEFFDGIMGEIRIYNRGLSALEIHHNYLATKWRYK